MEQIIQIINKYQDLACTVGTSTEIPGIPMIVVVGEQSSGKSSVLESIIGKPILPRGTGTVTRCPIILQLNQLNSSDADSDADSTTSHLSTPTSATGDPTEYCVFLHKPHEKFTNFDAVRQEIENETNRQAGSKKGIVHKEISLKIFSPNVINLTLVDLPGITKVPVGDLPADIEHQVKSLLLKYMQNEETIILAVCEANRDIGNSDGIKLAKEVDPLGERTIVVLTKLDLMDRGTDATEMLTGKIFHFKLGIVGVVNRSQEDINKNKSLEDSLKYEESFLRKKYPTLAATNGTVQLGLKLQRILIEKIRHCLPEMRSTIMDLIIETHNELRSYGEASTPEDKPKVVSNIINQFCKSFSAAILGKSMDIEKKMLTGGAKIKAVYDETLPKELAKINPERDISDSTILITLQNNQPLHTSFMIPEQTYQDLVRPEIGRLEEPALKCANLVNTQIQNIVQICMKPSEMTRFPNLASAITKEVMSILAERHEEAQNTLKKWIAASASYIVTSNPHFRHQIAEIMKDAISSKYQIKASPGKGLNENVDEFPTPTGPTYGENNKNKKPRDRKTSFSLSDRSDDDQDDEDEEEDDVGAEYKSASEEGDKMGDKYEKRENGEDERSSGKSERLKQCEIVRRLVTSYYTVVKASFQDFCPQALSLEVVYWMEQNLRDILLSRLYVPDKFDELVQEHASVKEKREAAKRRLENYKKANAIIEEVQDAHI